MKFLILALFVAVSASAPLEQAVEPVEVIVNGIPEGDPIELGNLVDITLKEHADGEVVAASDLLFPFTATGMAVAAAEAAAAEAIAAEDTPANETPEEVIVAPIAPEVVDTAPIVLPVVPAPIVLPAPALPEVVPEPIVLPAPAIPEVVPAPIVLPAPAVPEVVETAPENVIIGEIVPQPIALPAPAVPEVVETAPIVVEAAPEQADGLPNGEIFNDGNVVITVNAPQEASVLTNLQSWFQMVVNYFNGDVVTSQQIV